MKKNIFAMIASIFVGAVSFYFLLPAINIQSFGFWAWIALILGVYAIISLLGNADMRGMIREVDLSTKVAACTIFGIFFVIIVVDFFSSPLLQSRSYAERIKIQEDGNFTEDVRQVDFSALPLLDKDSSSKLGDRVMGQMPEMVSQFYVSDMYTQINYNNNIVRVTPLEYNGFFKYINNRKQGETGYITVNSVTGESNLIKLD